MKVPLCLPHFVNSKLTNKLNMDESFLPEDLLKIFTTDKYQMIIVSSEYENATDKLNNQIAKINQIIKSYDENSLMAGEGPLMKDLVEIANHDFNSVNTFSIVVIFIIMFFVLQSISLLIILIVVIEFAIFINSNRNNSARCYNRLCNFNNKQIYS